MKTRMEFELESRLSERLDAICLYLGITRQELIEFAIQREVARQEIHMVKNEITLQEIDRHVLGEGQSLTLPLFDENEELSRQMATCQMCLEVFDHPLHRVEGPWFCEECLAMAKGGDFTGLEPRF